MGSTFYFYMLELGCFSYYFFEFLYNELMNLTHLHLQYNLHTPIPTSGTLRNALKPAPWGKNSKHQNVYYEFY